MIYKSNTKACKTFNAAVLLLVINLSVVIELDHEAIIRGNTNKKQIALVFTADKFADGGKNFLSTLQKQHIKGSFFFYRKILKESCISIFNRTS